MYVYKKKGGMWRYQINGMTCVVDGTSYVRAAIIGSLLHYSAVGLWILSRCGILFPRTLPYDYYVHTSIVEEMLQWEWCKRTKRDKVCLE
jgi:hypothetical protein